MRTTIVYHDRCHDGITALWAALQAIPEAEPYPASYNKPPDLERLRGRCVIFVDFCWKPQAMFEVRGVAAAVLVLDHHKSAMEEMLNAKADPSVVYPCASIPQVFDMRDGKPPYPPGKYKWTLQRFLENVTQDAFENACPIYCYFDMDRSGAGLAWDVLVGGHRPKLIDYVEDRDLWRFALPGSREIHAACGLVPLTLESRELLIRRFRDDMEGASGVVEHTDLFAAGRSVLQYHSQLCADAAKFALREEIGGYNVPSLSLPLLSLGSDVGHILCKGEPFAAYWMDRPDGTRYYGLRSDENGIDVSEVAKQYGGGGHARAAGFTRKAST